MAKRLLAKGGERREFPSDIAADIAIEHLGWTEILPPAKPEELTRRIAPPEAKPIKIIQPVEIKPESKTDNPEPIIQKQAEPPVGDVVKPKKSRAKK